MQAADQVRHTLHECGYRLFFDTPTNLIFVIVSNKLMDERSIECIGSNLVMRCR